MLSEGCVSVIDNVIIFWEGERQHVKDISEVLNQLPQTKFTLKRNECHIFKANSCLADWPPGQRFSKKWYNPSISCLTDSN